MTDEAAVAAAAKQVDAALRGETLFGLVNNAGIAMPGPLLYQKIEDFKQQIAVNLVGHLIVIQAFAPLLGADRARKGAPGRIVMISSAGGKNASPFLGAYNASKFALEGMSESLRRELILFGIDVIVVAPGTVATTMWDRPDAINVAAFADTPYAPCPRQAQGPHDHQRQARLAAGATRRDGEDRAHGGATEGPLHRDAGSDRDPGG